MGMKDRRDFIKAAGGATLALAAYFTIPNIFSSEKKEDSKNDKNDTKKDEKK